jgi:hypothetical protein
LVEGFWATAEINSSGSIPQCNSAHERVETVMAGKNKGGREAKKPKQDQNKKQKGQPPRAGSVFDAIQGRGDKK